MNKFIKIFKRIANAINRRSRQCKAPYGKVYFRARPVVALPVTLSVTLAVLLSLMCLFSLFFLAGCGQGIVTDENGVQAQPQSGQASTADEQIIKDGSTVSKNAESSPDTNGPSGTESLSTEPLSSDTVLIKTDESDAGNTGSKQKPQMFLKVRNSKFTCSASYKPSYNTWAGICTGKPVFLQGNGRCIRRALSGNEFSKTTAMAHGPILHR